MPHTPMKVSHLCNAFPEKVGIMAPILQSFGGRESFWGIIHTLKTFENALPIKSALDKKGKGKVLVVDGGGLETAALFDKELASLAVGNAWQGVVIYGCLRDVGELSEFPIGIYAKNRYPLMSRGRESFTENISLSFGNQVFHPNHYIYCDLDGIVTSVDFLL